MPEVAIGHFIGRKASHKPYPGASCWRTRSCFNVLPFGLSVGDELGFARVAGIEEEGEPVRQSMATARKTGEEPIAGYRLIEPLGEGGFGQVWKCEAPGGLLKAIKFVHAGGDEACPAAQELAALQRVKSLRHPFILSLDRLEVQDGTLMIIMELADENLFARFTSYRAGGLPGIPREELLNCLTEAAEALDWMSQEHGLQHLDIKPHNLFLTSGHVKVADFGLVQDLGGEGEEGPRRRGGVTPLYSAPELLRGSLSRTSDQYSLAVVYQQMLTGTLPFWHANVYDLMMMHLTGEPDLSQMPLEDRPVLARALSKVPDQRYGSCSEFVQALAESRPPSAVAKRSGQWRRILSGSRPTPLPPPEALPPAPASPELDSPQATPNETPTRRVRAIQRDAQARQVPSGLEPAAQTCSSPDLTDTAAPAPAPAIGPLPTAVSLPGYRFLRCVNQTPLGDLWEARGADGGVRRALALLGYVRYDARLINHLQALRDPMLPVTEVHWSPAERLVVLTDPCECTLREHFERCLADGKPGVARAELLRLLRTAAEALDRLHARYGIQHLGLNPSNLLLDDGELRVADFGIIPLVWLPTGEPASAINGRYAAPELFDKRPSPSADLYSLALIYAEMLTGTNPRPSRPGSGAFRRQGAGRSGAMMRAVRLDLDLLPSHDRGPVSRALSPDPSQRFTSCLAFVEALEAAGRDVPPPDLYASLPGVIPYASLMGEPPGPDTVLPEVQQLMVGLMAGGNSVEGPQNARYRVLGDGTWEYRCPVQVFPGAMDLKVAGFVGYWHARVVSHEGDDYRLEFEVPGQRSFWDHFITQPRVVVDIKVGPGPASRTTEAVVQVRYQGRDAEQTTRVLNQISPKVFETVRTYFQAAPEQRVRERIPLSLPVRVYPVLPDLELAETMEATTRNVSFGGMSLLAGARPPVDHLYLHLYTSQHALGYALLGRVVRCQPMGEGFEIGVRFPERGNA